MKNLHKKMESFADRNLLSVDFIDWQNEVVDRIVKKQKLPFANYRKNKWKLNGRTFKNMHNEGLSPDIAANLWGLAHQK